MQHNLYTEFQPEFDLVVEESNGRVFQWEVRGDAVEWLFVCLYQIDLMKQGQSNVKPDFCEH
jgi:hypothetical protein